MKRILMAILILVAIASYGCTSQDDAERALYSAGYTYVEVGGFDMFACGDGDFYHTKFTATNPQGKRVSGVVCSGLFFKGATIRF